jgi:hypothetical protein
MFSSIMAAKQSKCVYYYLRKLYYDYANGFSVSCDNNNSLVNNVMKSLTAMPNLVLIRDD